jgi:Protein of unknown function (DUF4236)
MGYFRFYRRMSIFPGLSLNVSKSGPSLTFGMRGAHMTVGPRGVRKTVGIPGTGFYYTSQSGRHTGVHSAHTDTPISPAAQNTANAVADLIVLMALLGVALLIGIAIGSATSSGH